MEIKNNLNKYTIRALATWYPKIRSILVNNTKSIANSERLLGRKQLVFL